MRKDGLQRMLDFLNVLSEKDIHFFIEQYAPDYLTVTVALDGARIEVMFTVDEMQFSYFKQAEESEINLQRIYSRIREG